MCLAICAGWSKKEWMFKSLSPLEPTEPFDVLFRIASCADVDAVVAELEGNLRVLLDFDTCGLVLRNDGGECEFLPCSKKDSSIDSSFAWRLGSEAMAADSVQLEKSSGTQGTMLALPLSVTRRTFGALVLSSARDDAFQDISMARSISNHVALALDRLRQMARLERSNRALDASNLELQQFAYVASHDLKAPLRSISGFLQLIQCRYKGQLDAQADEWIDLTVGSAEQLKTLIEALLSYSRVESRARAFAEVSLSEVLDDASILDSCASIERDTLPTVIADGTQLVQLMQNLIGNAIKYQRSEPPRIHVSAEDCGHEWKFAVRDNGIGIDPKQHERIFEIFRRLHTEHAYPGTGIGLAICRRVVLRHGGTIWVESNGAVGEGSIFFFTLPKSIVH